MNENKTNINWYPGHMAKTKREIKEKIDLIDIVFEVLIMTKIDLCDKDKTSKWIKYYEDICMEVS